MSTQLAAVPTSWAPRPTRLATDFCERLKDYYAALQTISEAQADAPWRMGWWTRKQIVGHLLNSAANNRQRFVRAAIDGRYTGPQYAHDDWVAAHGYENLSWETLIRWWLAENQILMAVVLRIPDSRLDARCKVGDKPAVTLGFLIEEYLSHQQRHIQALVAT